MKTPIQIRTEGYGVVKKTRAWRALFESFINEPEMLESSMKKAVLLLGFILAVSLVLMGCGKTAPPTEPPTIPPSSASPPAQPEQPSQGAPPLTEQRCSEIKKIAEEVSAFTSEEPIFRMLAGRYPDCQITLKSDPFNYLTGVIVRQTIGCGLEQNKRYIIKSDEREAQGPAISGLTNYVYTRWLTFEELRTGYTYLYFERPQDKCVYQIEISTWKISESEAMERLGKLAERIVPLLIK